VFVSDTQEVASLQMDLLRLNRVFYHRVRKVKGINGKLDAVEQLPWFSVAEAQRRRAAENDRIHGNSNIANAD
jgi:hypothetical protein